MSHRDVYEHFKKCFPMYADASEVWFPNGKQSIRVRLLNKYDFIFTYNGNNDWKFETINSFIKSM